MKVLVTGGAGFIGSHLVRMLIQQTEHQILNIDALTYAGNEHSLMDIAGDLRYRFLKADICDATAIHHAFSRFKPDWVIHLAAESHVDRSIDGPGTFIQTNIIGTYTLLQAALEYWRSLPPQSPISNLQTSQKSFRFLHVSTDEVYGSLGETGAFTETTPYAPRSPYSASKASSDHLARAWMDTYSLPVIVTNCSNNYGPYQFPEKLIPTVILKAVRGEPIPVYGKGLNIRDWLYVEDHAEALVTAIGKGIPGQTYNIGGNNQMRNIDLVRLFCQFVDEELDQRPELRTKYLTTERRHPTTESLITFVTDRPGHDLRYAIDASKIRDELGWTPKQDHESGFRKTVRWYLDHSDWTDRILSGDYQLQRRGTQKQP